MTAFARDRWTEKREDSPKGSSSATAFTIRYRRPEAPWSLAKMTVPNGEEAALAQKARLEALGYWVIDIAPSIPPTTQKPPSA